MSPSDESSDCRSGPPRRKFRDNRRGGGEPPFRQPPGFAQSAEANEQASEDDFTMVVNGIRFLVRECRLNSPNYGFMNPVYVDTCFAEFQDIK